MVRLTAAVLLLLPFVAYSQTLTGGVVRILDGDTLEILVDRQQHRIRLVEIDAPEVDQDWGNRAKQALAEKVGGKQVRVEVSGTDQHERLMGRIWLGDRDINREMVTEGHAWLYRQYAKDRSLIRDEDRAIAKGYGLWGMPDPVEPWRWRQGERDARRPTTFSGTGGTCGSKVYCREMKTCAEAIHYFRDCGLTRIDGDGDGVPCENLCRR